MQALVITEFGEPEVLAVREIPKPTAAAGEVLVEVAAVALNPVDLQVRAGVGAANYAVQPPMIVGYDLSGVVCETGPGVREFQVGDQVVAMSAQAFTGLGTAAQYVAIGEGLVGRAPGRVPLPHAAALPLAGLTADKSLVKTGLVAGQTLLVVGAVGAVGGLAVQLARQRGIRVLGMGREKDAGKILDLGAERVFTDTETVPTGVADATLDTAGVPDAIATVRDGGRFVSIVPQSVPETTGSVDVVVSFADQDGPALTRLSALVDEGLLTIRVAKSFPFARAASAHRELGAGGVRGKVLLIPPPAEGQAAPSAEV